MNKIADRMKRVTYPIRDVIAAAQKIEATPGPAMLRLNIGDPNAYDFDTPQYIKQALYDAVGKGNGGYADSTGYMPLRKAVVEHNAQKGIRTGFEDVLITTGTSEATNMLYATLLNPGDEVLVPSPCYPQYENLAYFYGAEPVFYSLLEEEGYQPDFEQLEKLVSPRTRAIVAINPNNPTGAVFGAKAVKKFIDFAGSHGLVLISDEIYDRMVFEQGTHCTAASLSNDVPIVTLNGLSKNFLAPGWRVGWVTLSNFADPSLRTALTQLLRLRLSASLPMQIASVEALTNKKEYAAAHAAMMNKLTPRRDLAYRRLNELPGISCVKPQGAFYAFPKIGDEGGRWATDKEFTYQLLEQQRVLTVFGSGFGQNNGSKHFRIVFLPQEEVLNEAFDRMGEFLKKSGF